MAQLRRDKEAGSKDSGKPSPFAELAREHLERMKDDPATVMKQVRRQLEDDPRRALAEDARRLGDQLAVDLERQVQSAREGRASFARQIAEELNSLPRHEATDEVGRDPVSPLATAYVASEGPRTILTFRHGSRSFSLTRPGLQRLFLAVAEAPKSECVRGWVPWSVIGTRFHHGNWERLIDEKTMRRYAREIGMVLRGSQMFGWEYDSGQGSYWKGRIERAT